MKKIRIFLIRMFVLDYFITIFGKRYNAPRASRIIFPLMILTGLSHNFSDAFIVTIISWLLLLISLYFGFIHFSYVKPVRWEELDDLQKFQYGYLKPKNLTSSQYREWLKLLDK